MKPLVSPRNESSIELLENRVAPAGLTFTATRGIVNIFLDPTRDGTFDMLGDTFAPFPNYKGPLDIATVDLDGDGNSELVTSKANGTPAIAIWSVTAGGRIDGLIDTILPELGKSRGASVAGGDINGDGRGELIIGSGRGVAPVILVAGDADHDGLVSDETFDALTPFSTSFRGGLKVATGNTNNLGGTEVIVAMARGGGTVAVFSDVDQNGLLSNDAARKLEEFKPFGTKYRGGVNIASGQLSNAGGGGAEIFAVKATGKPSVLIFMDDNGNGLVSDNPLFDTVPLTGPGYANGANVAVGDSDNSGIFVELFTAPARGAGSTIKIYDDDGDVGVLLSDNPLDYERAAFNTPASGVTIAFGKVQTANHSLSGAPAFLADSSTTTLRFTVDPGAGFIADLDVGLAIAHTHNPDLDITLTHNGVSVILFSDIPSNSTSSDGFIIRLNDESGTDIGTAPGTTGAALTGSFTLEGGNVLSAFDGMDASGEWILTITDDAGGDTGTLFDWTLFFTF